MGEELKTLNVLYKLKKEILKSQNDTLVSQIDHAISKTYKNQLVFSFIGHYSAGKSSLINHLLEQDILPSSPVPTTSNTVAVQIGDDTEISAFLNQYQYVAVKDYGELRSLNTRDIDISAINIDVRHDDFKNNTVLQDTPGVDSNTDSHRESTNRFLLNSDFIFFTVEYNHVESEHNMALLKELSMMGIPLILIINQIDKHDDQEIKMDTFLSRIKNTLKDWNISLHDIITTSIYESPYNQVGKLKSFIHELERERQRLQDDYFNRITKTIENSQLEYLEDELSALESDDEDIDTRDIDAVKNHIKFLSREMEKSKVESLHDDEALLNDHVKDSARKIVKDSYIFPHEVKSSITNHLKIIAGEVKVPGLFGRKKKEEQMLRESRAEIEQNLNDIFKTEINAPINSFFGGLGLTGKPFRYEFNNDLLIEEEITHLNNQFILNYLDKFKANIISDVAGEVMNHLPVMEKSDAGELKEQSHLDDNLDKYENILKLLSLRDSIETTSYRHFYIHMDDEIDKLNLIEEVELDEEAETAAVGDDMKDDFKFTDEGRVDLGYYHEVIGRLDGKERYSDFQRVIRDKLERIDKGKANISVFGGFSAGKTTFINALLNKAHLAMSPNPTTATITEINNNESSEILFKTSQDLIDTLEMLSNERHSSVEEYFKWIKRERQNVPETYKPFLDGILNKYDVYKSDLGMKRKIDTDELIKTVSSDEDSTFVHKAFVSLQNEITDKYTLIDSPGINSINQRHTKETRNIIADSDLIIYVSYYNHVFSRSDETFLKYIQSIKGEDFPIIFIINAVDLMRSEADKNQVIDYMSNALISLGITHMIFPVSSKRALNNEDSMFDEAKENILNITDKLASNVQVQSIRETTQQLKLNIESNIRQYENADLERTRIETGRQNILSDLETFSAYTFQSNLYQETDVLLSFISKRLELKLYDYLKGFITVSDIQDKNYLVKNESLLKNELEHFLTIEVSTVFNTVYRQAEEMMIQNITQFNERLSAVNTPHTLIFNRQPEDEPIIKVDVSEFGTYSRRLHQARNNQKAFRDNLLDFAGHISGTLDISKLNSDMESLIDEYLNRVQEDISQQKPVIIEGLKQPLPVIRESDYEEDQKLLESLTEMKGD
ncbi:dynamin family protein [Lacicoccus qingdaonensis]|uniref:Small GTP-binding protein domain-containing protein n=1 Tax=Lacicoccus qingdaonensis TaxID=576118 RepID=A0A1G9CI43_9BACL|nr:dynamin family protein [Salinicoccus qingdaonensis]SDK51337.1 small GTP-binding protein domain-containing protein [Salinicoccus qingdaonensis]